MTEIAEETLILSGLTMPLLFGWNRFQFEKNKMKNLVPLSTQQKSKFRNAFFGYELNKVDNKPKQVIRGVPRITGSVMTIYPMIAAMEYFVEKNLKKFNEHPIQHSVITMSMVLPFICISEAILDGKEYKHEFRHHFATRFVPNLGKQCLLSIPCGAVVGLAIGLFRQLFHSE